MKRVVAVISAVVLAMCLFSFSGNSAHAATISGSSISATSAHGLTLKNASVLAPLTAVETLCTSASFVHIYDSSGNVYCFAGNGYVPFTIYQMRKIVTGNNNIWVLWYNGGSGHQVNYYAYQTYNFGANFEMTQIYLLSTS